jgi:hypothetical protein
MAEEQANIKHGTIRTDFHGLIELLAKISIPRKICLSVSWCKMPTMPL